MCKSKFEDFLIKLLDVDLAQNETIYFLYGNFGLIKNNIRICDKDSCLEFEWYIEDEFIYLNPRIYKIKLLKSNNETFSMSIDFFEKNVVFSITADDETIFKIKINIASGLKEVTKFENVIGVVDNGIFEAINRLSIDECYEKLNELLGDEIYNLDIKIQNDAPIGKKMSGVDTSNMIKLHKGYLQAFHINTSTEVIKVHLKPYHFVNEGIDFCSSWSRRLNINGATIAYREDDKENIGIEIDGESKVLQLARGKYSYENVKMGIQDIMQSMALMYDVKTSYKVKGKENISHI